VKRVLRRGRFSFRRARRVPAKKPAVHKRAAVEKALGKLRALQAKGQCDLVFGDETGFSLQPSVPYLWQPKGQTLEIPAQAHSKRVNVIGFLHDSGEKFYHHLKEGRVDAAEFIVAVETELLPNLERNTTLVLDNGSVHRAKIVSARRAAWKKKGLRLFFLPPYSPHLNRIETLWRFIKNRWLSPTAYLNFRSLLAAVSSILQMVGGKYTVTFA
jgi:hypothetical protein